MIEFVDNNSYDYKVANISQATSGNAKIDQSKTANATFTAQYTHLIDSKPLHGERIVCALPINESNALIINALHELGAEVRVCASAPVATDDDVAAALANNGIAIFAWNNEAWAEYWWCVMKAFTFANNSLPTILIDHNGKAIQAIEIGSNGEVDPNTLQPLSETDEGMELAEMIYMSHQSGIVWGNVANAIQLTISNEESPLAYLSKILYTKIL